MSRARDNANLGTQAGSGLDASDITTGVLPVGVTGGSGLNALSASSGALLDSELASVAAVKATTGTFLTADQNKLDGIEASADVTDTTNVTAAGALMDSECTDLAAVKATEDPFTAALLSKLNAIEASATADQTLAEINALDITELGTITSGVWQGTTVAVNQGGTGSSTSTGTGNVVLHTAPVFSGVVGFGNSLYMIGGGLTTASGGWTDLFYSNHTFSCTIWCYSNNPNPTGSVANVNASYGSGNTSATVSNGNGTAFQYNNSGYKVQITNSTGTSVIWRAIGVFSAVPYAL